MPSAAPLAAGQVAGITSSGGVRASTPALRSTFSLSNGTLGTLLALNARAASGIIPTQAAGPSAATLRRLAAAPPVGVVIPGRPAGLKLTALANYSELLRADEPTGQLDSQTARQITGLIRSVVHAEGLTAIAAAHDRALIDQADRGPDHPERDDLAAARRS